MTQAYNLAILANAVDTSGRLNVGTNATGVLPLANGGTGATNTVNSVVAGSGISVSTNGTQVTVSSSGGGGSVTSVATGNGLQGGTITTSGTLSVACPAFNTVGSYCFAVSNKNQNFNGAYTMVAGSNYSAGGNSSQIQSNAGIQNTEQSFFPFMGEQNLSGTWKWMASTTGAANGDRLMGIACRVS